MAAIGKIRKHSGLVIGIIGLAILAFIGSSMLKNTGRSGRRDPSRTNVGQIAGQNVSYRDFEVRYQKEIQKHKIQNQTEAIDDGTRTQILDQTWQQLIDEIVYGTEYEKIGLIIHSDELTDLVSGDDPHAWVVQSFTNPETGVFDKNQLIRFLKTKDSDPNQSAMWINFEDGLVKEAIRQKYFNLIKGSLYVTNLEAKEDYYGRNQFASFQYITIPLQSVPDSTVELAEDDIVAYYKEHLHLFQAEESRSFDYVTFDVFPTKEDTAHLLYQLEKYKKKFRETINDSLFVEVNSEGDFDTAFHPQGSFPKIVDDTFFTAEIGTVIGPFYDKRVYKLAKLVERNVDTIYYYKASHILFKPMGNTDLDTTNAMQKARDLMKEIQDGADFAEKAMFVSEDKGTAIKGGDLDWFKDGAMVKPFMDAVKKGKKDDLIVVKSQFGAHLIKITEDKTNTLIKVGILEKSVTPSSQTFQSVYSECTKFRSRINNSTDFEDVILEFELNKRIAEDIRPDAMEIPGLPNSKRLKNLAYNMDLDEVSEIIEFEDKFIVLLITKVIEKGPAALEYVRPQVESRVLSEQKRDMLINKLLEANKQNDKLEGIAKALQTNVEKASNVSYKVPVIAGIGNEHFLVGQVFGLKQNVLSEPIRGENAVFQIIISEYSKVEAPENFNETKKELFSNYEGMAQYETMEALNDISKIEDLRYKFY